MKTYLISLGAGLLVGIIYSLLGVRSPAPPAIALVGLLGILLGEQVVPLAKRIGNGSDAIAYLRTDCVRHVLGRLPGHRDA
jgi:XapX domain-containing protein